MQTGRQVHIQTCKQIDRQKERMQTGSYVNRKLGRQVDRQTRYIGRQLDMQTGRQVDMQTGRQVDMQTGRQVDMQTGSHVDRQICRQGNYKRLVYGTGIRTGKFIIIS